MGATAGTPWDWMDLGDAMSIEAEKAGCGKLVWGIV